MSQVDRVGRLAARIWVRESHNMGLRRLEYCIEQTNEFCIWGIVGPQPEDAAGMELVRQVPKPGRRIKSAVSPVKPMAG